MFETFQNAHSIAFSILRILRHIPFAHSIIKWMCDFKSTAVQRELFGITFRNPIGIAAGLDRKGEYCSDLALFGPGFVEVGPVRNVRRVAQEMGKRSSRKCIVSINIGGRKGDNFVGDTIKDFTLAYDFGNLLCVTVPNDKYREVIDGVFTVRRYNDTYKPVIIRLSPLLNPDNLSDVVHYALLSGADAVETPELFVDEVLALVEKVVPVVVVTELESIDNARQLPDKGVSLIALSTGLIKNGPLYIKNILKTIDR